MADRVGMLNSLMDQAVAAIALGDFSTAIARALAAQGLLAALPKLSRAAGSGGGTQSAEWDAAAIDNFVRRLRQQQGAALGVQSAPIEISDPAILDDGSQFANSSGGYVQ